MWNIKSEADVFRTSTGKSAYFFLLLFYAHLKAEFYV